MVLDVYSHILAEKEDAQTVINKHLTSNFWGTFLEHFWNIFGTLEAKNLEHLFA